MPEGVNTRQEQTNDNHSKKNEASTGMPCHYKVHQVQLHLTMTDLKKPCCTRTATPREAVNQVTVTRKIRATLWMRSTKSTQQQTNDQTPRAGILLLRMSASSASPSSLVSC